MIKFLITQGADKNDISRRGIWCSKGGLLLERALADGNIKIIRLIAHINQEHAKYIINTLYDSNQKTHLYCAIFNKNKELTKCLIECGANPNIHNNDVQWDMPLHLAIRHGDIKMVELLVQKRSCSSCT
jgi:ankyrin repeat protein